MNKINSITKYRAYIIVSKHHSTYWVNHLLLYLIRAVVYLWLNCMVIYYTVVAYTWYSPSMCYLVHLASINTDLRFKLPILKLILADDFVFTDGFLPFLSSLISSSLTLVFKTFQKYIYSNFIRTIITTKNNCPRLRIL